MMRNWRCMVVAMLVALGLIAQGMGMPVMAASGGGFAKRECQLMQNQCPSSGMDQHLGMQACQLPCVPPPVLPRASVAAVSIVWTPQAFIAGKSSIPSGLAPTPDPFPPRPVTLA